MEVNPYLPPADPDVVAEAGTNADEALRKEHLKHEASVKGLGSLCLLGGLGCLPLLAVVAGAGEIEILKIVLVAVLYLASWWGLRRLAPWSRIPATLVAALVLLAFPLRTMIGIYALYLFYSPKGRVVFSAEYRETIARTPHLRYRTPRGIWITPLIFLALAVAVIAWGLAIS